MTEKQRRLFRSLFFLFAWICLIVTLVSMMKVWPTSEQWKMILAGDRIFPILVLFGCFLMAILLRAIRWGLLLKGYLDFEWTHLFIWFPWAFFVITFSPFRTGELVKPLWVRSQRGSASMATGAVIVERITDVLVLFIFISLVGIYAPIVPEWINVAGVSYLMVMIAIYLLVIMLAEPLYKRIDRFNSENIGENTITQWLSLKTASLMEGILYIHDVKTNVMLLLITIFTWSSVALGFYFYLNSFFENMHWTVAVAVMGAVNLSSLISLVPGNLGVFELTAVATLVIFSISPSDALVATIGYHSLILLFTVFCGSLAKLALQKKGQRLWEVI